MTENETATVIVDVAYHVHVRLGLGLFEAVYEAVMEYELRRRGLVVTRQQPVRLLYDDMCFDQAYKADLVVNDKVMVELKSVEKLGKVHYKQLQTYLKISGLHLGLLINFNEAFIANGIHRVVNGLSEP